jgi:hypothetical protein
MGYTPCGSRPRQQSLPAPQSEKPGWFGQAEKKPQKADHRVSEPAFVARIPSIV